MSAHTENSTTAKLPISQLDTEIAWLRDRGVGTPLLASLFGTNENHIRQLVYQGRHRQRKTRFPEPLQDVQRPFDPFEELPSPLLTLLGIRRGEDSVLHYTPQRRRIGQLEEEVEDVIDGFFGSLRSGRGLSRLRSLLPKLGHPAHFRLVRLLARIRFQLAVTQIHLGRARSAVEDGLRSLHLSRRAYQSSDDPLDLKRAAHSASVVSQAYVLRFEPAKARSLLALHRQILESVGEQVPAGAYRRLAVLSLQEDNFQAARHYFALARRLWQEEANRTGQVPLHEIPNYGPRQSNILPPVNWESSLEVLDSVRKLFPRDHIQVAMNLNWTAACGLATDSRSIQQHALGLLQKHAEVVTGYGHQATIRKLLCMTPGLRPTLRLHWARRVLYANAFRNQ